MRLPIFVSQEKWQEFDEGWQELIGSGEPIDDLLDAIRLAGTKKRMASRTKQAHDHSLALTEEGRHSDAARLAGTALVAGGNPADLTEILMEAAQTAWAEEVWFEPYCELTGLRAGGADLRGPWRSFAKLCAFEKGALVYHPGGWGSGEIQEVTPARLEMKVRFWNKREDTFPLHAAVEIFEPLREADLRGRHFRDPEGVIKEAKKDPLDALRAITATHNGRATTAAVRNAMMGIGVEGSAWSAWWRKARKLAENSEWFEVTGTPQKSIISLLLTAKDPMQTLRKTLERASGLAQAHSKVRDLLTGGTTDEALVEMALGVLEEHALMDSEPLEDRVAVWLLLRAKRGESPPQLAEALAPLIDAETPADPATPPALWQLFRDLPSVKDQERALDVMPELLGETWLDEVCAHLPHAGDGQVRPLVDRLLKENRQDAMSVHYAGLLARPHRAPALLVSLAGIFERQELSEGFPTRPQRAHALLNLATNLYRSKRGNPQMTRVCGRLTELLAGGTDPLLRTLLAEADDGTLRGVNTLIKRGVESEIDHMVTEICIDRDRHFYAGQSGPFWEGETIWTTKAGLERRSAELRVLVDEKIPANQEAIGRAASFGDLSENSEWEAAIAEQRTLTGRAMEIEEELRLAGLLEEVAIPVDTVCPGSIVRYRELESGNEERIVILGPWDGEQWQGIQVVSYRAPLAAGLLGLQVGAVENIVLPAGEIEIQVLEQEIPAL
ncbi:MAG: GreA/GreB family elongation factor [bacterium]